MRIRKQYIGEWIEILIKERGAVIAGSLTKEEIQAVKKYWTEQGYGKILLLWHRKYKAYSGILDPRYFPEYLFTTQVRAFNEFSFDN